MCKQTANKSGTYELVVGPVGGGNTLRAARVGVVTRVACVSMSVRVHVARARRAVRARRQRHQRAQRRAAPDQDHLAQHACITTHYTHTLDKPLTFPT